MKDYGKKIKAFAPALSIALVAGCAASSLSGYTAPTVVEAQADETSESSQESGSPIVLTKKTEATEEETEITKGSFDLADGIYQGTGTGYNGSITVSVQIKDKQITSIDILSSADDAEFFNRAKKVIDNIINHQSLDVDTISGATFSSNGIISAVKNALTGEKDSGETGASQSGGTAAAGSSTTLTAVEDASAYKDGTYYGTGTGFGGTLKVQVEISGGKIASVQLVESNDGAEYISKASSIFDRIVASQSTNVDTVSGATYSSVGIIQAVRNALSQAAVDSTQSTQQEDSSKQDSTTDSSQGNTDASEDLSGRFPYNEGIYYGSAEGYSGEIKLAVAIQENTIKAIVITENQDDAAFFNRAMSVVKNVIKTQSTEVDTVSGATYSSKGLLEAIKEALKQAEKVTNGEDITEVIDYSELNKTMEEATALVEEEYTEASWAVFKLRLEEAEEALNSESQQSVDTAKSNLQEAMLKLEKKENEEDPDTIYIDGIYPVTVVCNPDEDEDFESYNLSMNVIIRNDAVVGITDVTGDGDSGNNRYILKASNGSSNETGVITQIINKGLPEEIDAVTNATCSSNSIIEGCKLALENAKRTDSTEAEQ